VRRHATAQPGSAAGRRPRMEGPTCPQRWGTW
jgi:hypothetical protein